MKPLIVGMNNPISQAPGHELYPAPEGCAGHRLWSMLDAAHRAANDDVTFYRTQYLAGFDRMNLVVGRAWHKNIARCRADEITRELFGTGRRVVLLGREVQAAFGVPPIPPCDYRVIGGITWYSVPHPSGRNLFYNDPDNRRRTGELLLRLYEEGNPNKEKSE